MTKKVVKNTTTKKTAAKPTRLAKKELDRIREVLLQRKRRLHTEVQKIMAAATSSSDNRSVEIMDMASDSFDDDMAISLANNEVLELRAIDRALGSVEEGLYGLCSKCGEPIHILRLEALPFATTCIDCTRKLEATDLTSRVNPNSFGEDEGGGESEDEGGGEEDET